MDGPAPAIVSAIEAALGIAFNSIPLLPEDIFEATIARDRITNDGPTLQGVR